MELLIIKTGNDYIRIKDNVPLIVKLDKASVFPVDQLEKVKETASGIAASGFADVRIKKLILTEEDL